MKQVFKKYILKISCLILLVTSIYSCKVGENYVKPEIETPLKYRSDFSTDSSFANMAWWELFQDTVLQNIVNTTLKNNIDLKVSALRIQESEINMGMVKSNLSPMINYGVGGNVTATTDASTGSFNPAVNVSYEVDLWGKLKRLNEAALQEYLATEQAYRSLTISLIATVATNYLVLRDIDNRIIISDKMAKTWQSNLDIMKARHKAGFVSGVNVEQAEIQLAEALASIITYERLRSQTENSISLLMGVPPQQIPRGDALENQVFPPELPVGLPSELLSRRPDIQQAERKLNAQFERIGVAEALQYPSLVISANLGAQIATSSFGFASLGAQLLGPIFNGKYNKRKIEIEKNRTEQLLQVYEQSFLLALGEVENNMIAVEKYKQEYEVRAKQMAAANNAVKLSWIRFDSGLTDYLEILDLQRSQFSSNLKASQAFQLQLTSTINLYKALGGGWNPQ